MLWKNSLGSDFFGKSKNKMEKNSRNIRSKLDRFERKVYICKVEIKIKKSLNMLLYDLCFKFVKINLIAFDKLAGIS